MFTLQQSMTTLVLAGVCAMVTAWIPAAVSVPASLLLLVLAHFGAQYAGEKIFGPMDLEILRWLAATYRENGSSVIAVIIGAMPLMLWYPEALIAYAVANGITIWFSIMLSLELGYWIERKSTRTSVE